MASPWYESDIESYQEGAFIMAIQKEVLRKRLTRACIEK